MTAVELVQCLSSRCKGRGACAMAVELEQWWWSLGGACATVVKLVDAFFDVCSSCNGCRALYKASQACAMLVKPVRHPLSLCNGSRSQEMAVEILQWSSSSCDEQTHHVSQHLENMWSPHCSKFGGIMGLVSILVNFVPVIPDRLQLPAFLRTVCNCGNLSTYLPHLSAYYAH